MTNEQILKKAIQKATKNGFNFANFLSKKVETMIGISLLVSAKNEKEQLKTLVNYKEIIIFSRDFAKAFWGEKHKDVIVRNMALTDGIDNNKHPVVYNSVSLKWWQYHLQQMVLKPDLIKYLEKFL